MLLDAGAIVADTVGSVRLMFKAKVSDLFPDLLPQGATIWRKIAMQLIG